MTNRGVLVGLVALLAGGSPRAQSQSIAAAVLPLPTALREGATVVRLDNAFQPEVLRQGTNGIVCIADLPVSRRDRLGPSTAPSEVFDVRCYRESFIPVVYRTFQLGYSVAGDRVGAEIKAGTFRVPGEPTAGYRCLGPLVGYDASRNMVDARIECWQSMHFPFRTATDVGFPDEAHVSESQQRTTPYVMASGTYWSHLMIPHPD